MPASRVLAVSPIEQVEHYGDPGKATGSLDQAACREAGACRQASRRHHHGAGPRAHRLVVKKGAPHPDISSVEAFKRTLLGQIDRLCRPSERRHQRHLPGAGPGKAWHRRRAEIEDSPCFVARRPKLAASWRGRPRGEAEIGIQPISEMMEVPGIDVVGPLPADLQSPDLAVRLEGANHQWRKKPPRELSIDLVADERLGRVTGRAGAS